MNATEYRETTAIGPLAGQTAADLMSPNPVSIRDGATWQEAVAFLTDTGFSAAPVIDDAGRPVGVISRTDIVVHDRAKVAFPPSGPFYFETPELVTGKPATEQTDTVRVRDLMTRAVFAVDQDTPAAAVVRSMVELHVHRLFVADRDGVLVGVITALDLLRRLCP